MGLEIVSREHGQGTITSDAVPMVTSIRVRRIMQYGVETCT